MQGKCHKCHKWVNVEGIKDVPTKVRDMFTLVMPLPQPLVGQGTSVVTING